MQILGIFIILIALGFTFYWVCGNHKNKMWVTILCFISIFVGIAILFQDRAIELTIPNVATIKAAAKKIEVDAEAISDIKKQVEQQAERTTELEKAMERRMKQGEKRITKLQGAMEERMEQEEKRIIALKEAIDNAALQTSKTLPTKEESKLAYSKHSVQKTADGIETIIIFKSSANLPLGRVEFFVEIEDETNAKILSINPAEIITFAVTSTIGKNRRKGHLNYLSIGSSSPGIKVMLSAPAKLIIKGEPDLKPFELDIK